MPGKMGYPDRGVGMTEQYAKKDLGQGPAPPPSSNTSLKAARAGRQKKGAGKKMKVRSIRSRSFGGGY